MTMTNARLATFVLGLGTFLLFGCGSSQPEGPQVTDLGSQSFNLAPGTGASTTVTVPAAGTATATATWKSQDADIDVYWTDTACGSVEDLVLGNCHVLASGKSTLALTEIVSLEAAPGTYKLFVLALGSAADSGTVSLILRH
jgi:hypothetical protein